MLEDPLGAGNGPLVASTDRCRATERHWWDWEAGGGIGADLKRTRLSGHEREHLDIDGRSVFLDWILPTAPNAREREERARLLALEREPVPRGWLHVTIGLAERARGHKATALLEGVPPKPAGQHLVIADVRDPPRCFAVLREHEAPRQHDEFMFAIIRTADNRAM